MARVSVPATVPPALNRGTHRKVASWCTMCISRQSAGRLLAGTAPEPEVERSREEAGCSRAQHSDRRLVVGSFSNAGCGS